MRKKKILFICGTINQTTMMHKISLHLPEYEHFFSTYYADGWVRWLAENGYLDNSILGGHQKAKSERYLNDHDLQQDYRGERHEYDLVLTCNDVIVPMNVRHRNLVLVQEGMADPENLAFYLVKYLGIPRFMANTAYTGKSRMYTKFCVASEGFKDLYTERGADESKIVITGIPNFDNCAEFLENDFPYHDYVLSATSCLREVYKFENRKKFIYKSLDVAGGRQLIFKLHPNENKERASREIRKYAPQALIYEDGNTNHMIANCSTLVTKYSTVLLVAKALQKQVYCDLRPELVQKLTPVQNNGISAEKIADECLEFLT